MLIIPDSQDKDKAENRKQAFTLQHEHKKRCYQCSTSQNIRERRKNCETYDAYCTLMLHLPK